MHRVEVSVHLAAPGELSAWRIDFPAPTPVPLSRSSGGSIILRLQSVDISARVLLTSSRARLEEVEAAMAALLPTAATALLEGTAARLDKTTHVESELAQMGAGQRQDAAMGQARRLLEDARALLEGDDPTHAWELATEARQVLRAVVNNQMVAALSPSARQAGASERLDLLRHSYYTLPTYYRETSREDERSVIDYT
jgi:hypothetical protein